MKVYVVLQRVDDERWNGFGLFRHVTGVFTDAETAKRHAELGQNSCIKELELDKDYGIPPGLFAYSVHLDSKGKLMSASKISAFYCDSWNELIFDPGAGVMCRVQAKNSETATRLAKKLRLLALAHNEQADGQEDLDEPSARV